MASIYYQMSIYQNFVFLYANYLSIKISTNLCYSCASQQWRGTLYQTNLIAYIKPGSCFVLLIANKYVTLGITLIGIF